MQSKVVVSLDFGEISPASSAFAAGAITTRAPHVIHISVIGVTVAPQFWQKLLPAKGLAPQLGQISGVPISSLPQFLQNIFTSLFDVFLVGLANYDNILLIPPLTLSGGSRTSSH